VTGDYPNWIETPPIPLGVSHTIREGSEVAILAIGSMVQPATEAAGLLSESGTDPWVIDMRSVKPLDREILLHLALEKTEIVTVEEHTTSGGFGSAVMEAWEEEGLPPVRFLRLGIRDRFVEHGDRAVILQRLGLDPEGIAGSIERFMKARDDYAAAVHGKVPVKQRALR
jgi:1-deoxy-D-xylulose-5-phosphate synthase